ncbi:MAG: endo alpha-1,4 polygalactosaminidase [Hyphomicrobiales bacterium]
MVDIQRASHPTKAKKATPVPLSKNALNVAVAMGLIAGLATAPTPAASAQQWRPSATDSWQWQLLGDINTSYDVDVYDIDLFDAPDAVIAALHADGRKIVCYFSAGSSENWRDDFALFDAADLGNPLEGWDGERWLDTRSANVRSIMLSRLDHAVRRGCDGVEPDNVDGYQSDNDAGLPLTAQTQINFAEFLVAAAHERGLAIGLKNDVGNVPVLAAIYDFAVNEECHALQECEVYRAFTDLGKPVFNAEYEERFVTNQNGARDEVCVTAAQLGLQTLILPLSLDDSFRHACPGAQ